MICYKVLLVDDHELIIDGIKNLLAAYPRYQVVAQVDDGLAVYAACRDLAPDIVILDLGLPGLNGLDIIPQLCQRWPDLRILALTAHDDELTASRVLRAGALAYVLKTSSQQILLAAITSVAAKKSYVDPNLNQEAVHRLGEGTNDDSTLLTRRERQILQLISEGNGNRNIAEMLSISVKTVETHRLNMMRKLKVHKVTELLKYSRKLGLIT
ncbi:MULTISPECIES: two component system response regulator [Photorhabdus]|uniref:Two-component response regulator n=2 Tax=Photorhabdus asymbiotica TaxID=291112 RepID=B6VL95_PHOAA|nr:LuxR family two component transcriptional regulator [Photorhabdus asymbiotica]CAQ85869.1 putative two-component response regulator [Photorhabdus asymbiotica]CAR66925.1 putative two-component response regulator [Photorhabdus asymbiotica subsp. asymbiotica ATCC 43949]